VVEKGNQQKDGRKGNNQHKQKSNGMAVGDDNN